MTGFVLVLLAAAGPAFTIPAKVLPTYRFEVQVRVNDAGPFWCSFDTGGSSEFALDRDKGERAGLHATAHGRSSGAGAAVVDDDRLSGATLKLGDLTIPNRTVVLRPMGTGADIDCIFGAATVAGFVVQMDYSTPAVRLFRPADFPEPLNAIAAPMKLDRGNPIVTAKIALQGDDIAEAELLVDSGCPQWPLVLSKAFIDEKQLLTRVRKAVAPPFVAVGTGGEVSLLAARMDRLSVGEASITSPVAILFRTASASPDHDGLICGDFLRRFLVTLDYPGGRLLLEPNASLDDPPYPFDSSGSDVRPATAGFVVHNVLADSPAARAGLQKGDVVIAIDGEPAAQLTVDRIREKLYRPNGKTVIKVRRGEHELTVTIELKPVL